MLLAHFYPMYRKKQKPGLYLQEAGNTLTLKPQLFCQQIDKKKHPLAK